MHIKTIFLIALLVFATGSVLAQEERISDEAIVNAILADLEWEKDVSSQFIAVDCDDGVVTLSGTVENILSRERAKEIAASIRGVRDIVDDLRVVPAYRMDEQVYIDVINALSLHSDLAAAEITVSVENSVVDLEGTVSSYRLKKQAERRVKSVMGVAQVLNHIEVDPKEVRTDVEIWRDIMEQFERSPGIDASNLEVYVTNAHVDVVGVVGSIQELNDVIDKADVPGVLSINGSGLRIEGWRNDWIERQKNAPVSDSAILTMINDLVNDMPGVNPYDLTVDVQNSIVYIEGKVTTIQSRQRVLNDIATLRGVRNVVNDISVVPSIVKTDWEIENELLDALEWAPYVQRYDITLWVEDGAVTLYGSVYHFFEKKLVEDLVSSTNGVVNVKNDITVEKEWPYKEDWKIKNDVLEKLRLNAYLSDCHIEAEVENGVVVLQGTVDNWKEYQVALEGAFAAGARAVQMNIEVHESNILFMETPRYFEYGRMYWFEDTLLGN